jgi:hypothetical protein
MEDKLVIYDLKITIQKQERLIAELKEYYNLMQAGMDKDKPHVIKHCLLQVKDLLNLEA